MYSLGVANRISHLPFALIHCDSIWRLFAPRNNMKHCQPRHTPLPPNNTREAELADRDRLRLTPETKRRERQRGVLFIK